MQPRVVSSRACFAVFAAVLALGTLGNRDDARAVATHAHDSQVIATGSAVDAEAAARARTRRTTFSLLIGAGLALLGLGAMVAARRHKSPLRVPREPPPRPGVAVPKLVRICPRCGKRFQEAVSVCRRDGADLVLLH